jgi:hypothetical protein
MATLSLSPAKQQQIEDKVQAEIERRVAEMVEWLEGKIEHTVMTTVQKRIEMRRSPLKLAKLNGMVEQKISEKFHRTFWKQFSDAFARLHWRIRDTHDRLTLVRDWVKRSPSRSKSTPTSRCNAYTNHRDARSARRGRPAHPGRGSDVVGREACRARPVRG